MLVPVDPFTLEFVARTVVRVHGLDTELLLLPVRPPIDDLAVVLERLEGLALRLRLLPTRQGEVAAMTLAAAEELRPDVIALATMGYGRWRFSGDPAQEVLRSHATPVLVCNPTETQLAALDQPIRTILVPLDGSALADEALLLAIQQARFHHAELVLFHVQEFFTDPEPRTLEDMGLLPHDRDVLRALRFPARSLDLLEGRRALLNGHGRAARCEAALGEVGEEILHRAQKADLIVMATNGASGASPWWLGSVAKRVVRQTPVPALILRTGREPSRRPESAAAFPLHEAESP